MGAPFRSQTTNVFEGAGFAENGCSDRFLAADDFHRFVADNNSTDEGAQVSLARGRSPHPTLTWVVLDHSAVGL